MRFRLGPISSDFTPDDSWRPMREPGPFAMQVCALPIGLGLMLAIGYCWQFLGTTSFTFSRDQDATFAVVILFLPLLATIVVHEFIHAVAHPRLGCSESTVIGAWPSRMVFYAAFTGPLSRNRFLAILILPFLVITILPLVFAVVGVLPGHFAGFILAWCSTWNALFSCGDIFFISLVLWQVPRHSIVQNQSWYTYWRATNAA